jgi:hypothetical protein
MPGLALVDEVSLNTNDPKVMQNNVIKLQQWSLKAQEHVKTIATQVSRHSLSLPKPSL